MCQYAPPSIEISVCNRSLALDKQMPHLPCCHLEAGINERLQALHQPLGTGKALSCQEGVKVPGISAHRDWDVQDAPTQH